MKRHLFLSLLALLLFAGTLCAQPPKKFYTKFGGDGDDIAYSGKQILDGQYIVAGSSTSYFSNGKSDMYLVKVDSFGFPGWQRFIGGIGNDVAKSVIQLPDSGFVLAGYTSSYGAGGYDAYIVRTDKNGDVIWEKTWGGEDWDYANDLVQASDGHIVVVGHTSSFGSGKKDGFALKYDINGNLLWQKFYGGAEDEELRSVIKTNDNLLATTGLTKSRGDVNGDGYFLKLDLNGDTIFTKKFGGPFVDYACDLVQKVDGDFIMCGGKSYGQEAKTRAYYYRMSSVGVHVMDTTHYDSSIDEFHVSVANSRNTSILTAFLRTLPVPNAAMQGNIRVAYPNGYEYAVNSFGGTEDEMFYSIEQARNEGFVMVGYTKSFSSHGLDVFFIKIDDASVLTYQNVVGIEESIQGDEQEISISYQNPTTVVITLPETRNVSSLKLFDVTGRLIMDLPTGEKRVVAHLPSNHGLLLLKTQYLDGSYSCSKILSQ